MQQYDMDALLEGELVEGEQLLWSGRPDPHSKSPLSAGRVFLIMGSIFGLVGFILLIVATILLAVVHQSAATDASIVLFSIGGPFLFIGLLFLIFGVVFRFTPKNHLYAITDRRAIVVRTGRILSVDSYGKADIGAVHRIERPDGTGDLTFINPRNPFAYGYNNSYSAYGYQSGGAGGAGQSVSGAFIGISNVHSVERMFIQTFK